MLMSRGGLANMLKDGAKHLSGLEEAVIRNTEACAELAEITRTSLGPNGMNKMIINKHDSLSITNDAATIIKGVDVYHPAAKMLSMASEQQEQEHGDGTNFVISFGGNLLKNAEALLRSGLHPSDIVAGYIKAGEKAQEYLETLTAFKSDDLANIEQVSYCIRAVIASKQYGYEKFLSNLIAKACVQILPKNQKSFNVENVRVCKILGGGVTDSKVVKGFVTARNLSGTIKHVTSAKIAVFAAGVDISKTETKGNVILKSAQDLAGFSKGEEELMEEIIKSISAVGTKVIVSGGVVGDLATHYIERYNMMLLKTPSKFELMRICRATGATPLVRLGAPTPEELGFCDVVSEEEIGSTKVTIFRQDEEESLVSTIVVRASTRNRLDDIERAIDDGVNVFKGLTKDSRLVAGAGAVEIELSRLLDSFGDSSAGLDQYAIKKYAQAFEVIPRTLAETSGFNATEVLATLFAAHQEGKKNDGVDVDSELGGTVNALDTGILDHQLTKASAIKLATDAAVTILRVDQIIMAKDAGGPTLPRQGNRDGD
eukprot:TRINITY_DN3833_c0_g1_i1.p1 TRINITY_DN3833_c0_g1~~TRINITY_DN3833_c0_g1_i1.p1  ORF type:complete len:543 (-),score=141.93 TRINITY_DN3833_c0_g1_i1:55-1683(-)